MLKVKRITLQIDNSFLSIEMGDDLFLSAAHIVGDGGKIVAREHKTHFTGAEQLDQTAYEIWVRCQQNYTAYPVGVAEFTKAIRDHLRHGREFAYRFTTQEWAEVTKIRNLLAEMVR